MNQFPSTNPCFTTKCPMMNLRPILSLILFSWFLFPQTSTAQLAQAEQLASQSIKGYCYSYQTRTSGYVFSTRTNYLHFCASGNFIWQEATETDCAECPRASYSNRILCRGKWHIDSSAKTGEVYVRIRFQNGDPFFFTVRYDRNRNLYLESFRNARFSGYYANCP